MVQFDPANFLLESYPVTMNDTLKLSIAYKNISDTKLDNLNFKLSLWNDVNGQEYTYTNAISTLTNSQANGLNINKHDTIHFVVPMNGRGGTFRYRLSVLENYENDGYECNDEYFGSFNVINNLSNENIELSAQLLNNSIKLNWLTQRYIANTELKLFKSIDGINFNEINTQLANSNNRYSFIDDKPIKGKNYYKVAWQGAGLSSKWSQTFVIDWK